MSVSVAIFHSKAEAEPVANRLRASGINVKVHEGSALAKFWFVSRKESGARLEVAADQLDQACKMLIDRPDGAMKNAIRCPKCESFRVEYPQFTHKFLLPNLVMGLFAAIGKVEKQYYCSECHHTWPKRATKPIETSAHGSPDYLIDKPHRSATRL